MKNKESKKAIFAAYIANVGIAISKFIAFLMTGATSMLAEAVHSFVDSSNQILLLIGIKQSKKLPSKTHPFGYGRAHYLYAFIVSIVLFSLGGIFAVYEGAQKVINPTAIESPAIAYFVLSIAVLLEGYALLTVTKEARSFKPKNQNWWQFLKRTKSINHIVLALEDSAALIGLLIAGLGITISLLTSNPVWDGVSTLLIGLLLVIVAIILFREVKSLLIGEAADPLTEFEIRKIVLASSYVNQIVDLKTLYVGPLELFIAMKVIVDSKSSATNITETIDEIEARIRQAYPIARLIYIEPDLYKTAKEQKISDSKMQIIAKKHL